MMIEKLNGANPVANIQKSLKIDDVSSYNTHDSVTVSKEAEKFAEVHFAMEAVKNASDIRLDKVQEMKAKLKDPSYFDNIINSLADKIMEAYGI
ncbi:MAG: flagellar biosynthesis anti-sigma factor FlgM [Treponema sp.]